MRRLRALVVVALVAGVSFIAATAPGAGTALVRSVPLSSPDAIVSLASHEWERLPAAAAQAARHPQALVVLTVPREVTTFNCHDCARRPARLMAAGVAAARIREVPLNAGGTYGEAQALKAFMTGHHLARLQVVTSPYHTRRSLATFDSVFAGTNVAVGMVPASGTSPARPDRWWAAPYDRAYVRYEWAALLYYRLKYGVPFTRP